MPLTPLRRSLAGAGLEPRVVWILGSGRSGSTWLLNLLRSFGDVVAVDEPLLGAHLSAPLSAVTSLEDVVDPLIYDESRQRAQYFFSDAHRSAWRPGLRRMILARFADEVLTMGGGARRRPLVVVKEPNGSVAAPLLMAATPRARLLFLVRDGRDVVDSSIDAVTSRWATGEDRPSLQGPDRAEYIERRARLWVQATEATHAAYQSHDPARRLLVRYEDLRTETEAELTAILRWLGRSPAPDRVRDVAARLSFESLPAERTGPGQFARAATPGLWSTRFSPEEQEVLQAVLGPTLASLGYET